MTQKVTSELIELQARQLQELDLTPERCEELASEVHGYNQTVRQAALELDFDHEPIEFRKALQALAGERRDD